MIYKPPFTLENNVNGTIKIIKLNVFPHGRLVYEFIALFCIQLLLKCKNATYLFSAVSYVNLIFERLKQIFNHKIMYCLKNNWDCVWK